MNFTANDILAAQQEMAKRGMPNLAGVPPKLVPVFTGESRYRGAYGGRGSSKTRTFAKQAARKGDMFATQGRTGVILCAREFQNSLDDSSFAEVVAAIQSDAYLRTRWEIGSTYIRHVTRKVEFLFRGLRHNKESLKGIARILLAWADEAEQIQEESWAILIPTVREDGSEIWITWNRSSKSSATNKRFIVNATEDMQIVEMNFRDNPYFPDVLEQERLRDLAARPDDYDHIWEGAYKTSFVGSYYSRLLKQAEQAGRITDLAVDPLMAVRAFWDIGGTGAKADATAIWIAQFVGEKIKVLDYYEAQGQDMATHVNWLRANDYGHAECYLPHDGAHGEKVFDTSYEKALREAGFSVRVVPNQGKGAAMKRVEAGRRWLPRTWFDKERTQGGREALAAYHEKRDEERGIGLGPNHDWSSHGSDAAGLMWSCYEEPKSMGRIVLPKMAVA